MAGVFFAPLELTEDKDWINQSVIAASEAAGIPIVLLDRFQKRVTIKPGSRSCRVNLSPSGHKREF